MVEFEMPDEFTLGGIVVVIVDHERHPWAKLPTRRVREVHVGRSDDLPRMMFLLCDA